MEQGMTDQHSKAQRFVVSHYDEADFKATSERAYLLKRDLGVVQATDGMATVHVVRAGRPCEPEGLPGAHRHYADFQYFYVLKGWQRMTMEGEGEITVRENDGWLQPKGIEHEVLEYSDDLEVLCISMPASFETVET
jgi:mannose-6-phosphate isomerase-like protein (cupin superfamily)